MHIKLLEATTCCALALSKLIITSMNKKNKRTQKEWKAH